MKELRLSLIYFTTALVLAGTPYFLTMLLGGNTHISANNQDWGGFGSYIGGIISPAASILAGYLVYKSFALNAHQQELQLARESLARLDMMLDKKLETPFNSSILGETYNGQSLRSIIIALSNNEATADKATKEAILSLLHNIAITANSIRYYIGLLNTHPSSKGNNEWLGELEKAYWIEKYSAICSRMIRVVGKSSFEAKVSGQQLYSFKLVLQGGHGL
ncbi:hypothetical protein [Pseudomonas putida]|uniref:hypothetical protein n=1 Tax=Pseudomonas putida TaxID=303 RepID=UPI00235BE4F5|nr:hypothetical protein [Pseudomonas putida]GLO24201.1 hypothetical protein PPUJ21368_20290 [Pseudomonas putida]HDS0967724.1 hypothetical protein [Pseudomonas putida]